MTTGRDERLPFVIDVCDRFTPSQVGVKYEVTLRPTTPALEELIATEWERQTAEAHRTGRLLFNGSLLRYIRHRVSLSAGHREFLLTVGPTCYRDFVGTNLFNHHRLTEFDWDLFANPIGTTVTLVSGDHQICYGRRSQRVAYHAGYVHTFGGAVEERDISAAGQVDIFGGLLRELTEELSLQPDEVENLCCVGLIRDQEIHQPEVLFEGRLRMSAEDLRRRWASAEAADEHEAVVTLPDQPEAVVPFIRECGPIAPVAIGALMLHGRLWWGQEWFREAAGELAAPGTGAAPGR